MTGVMSSYHCEFFTLFCKCHLCGKRTIMRKAMRQHILVDHYGDLLG